MTTIIINLLIMGRKEDKQLTKVIRSKSQG